MTPNRAFAALLFLALLLPALALACSQCMCGSPLPAQYLWGAEPDHFRFGLEERYLSKKNALDEGPGHEDEREHRVSGFALWHPSPRALFVARVPYAFKELREHPDGEVTIREKASGFANAEVTAAFQALQAINGNGRVSSLTLVGGVQMPTGQDNKKDDAGDRLEEHLQPGSGAWTESVGAIGTVPVGTGAFEVDALGRWNGTNDFGYQYGNAFLANAGYSTRLFGRWQFLGFVNGRVAARDTQDEEDLVHTGGTMIYAAPGVRYWSRGPWVADLAVQIPVVSNLYGDQTEHATGRLSLSYAP